MARLLFTASRAISPAFQRMQRFRIKSLLFDRNSMGLFVGEVQHKQHERRKCKGAIKWPVFHDRFCKKGPPLRTTPKEPQQRKNGRLLSGQRGHGQRAGGAANGDAGHVGLARKREQEVGRVRPGGIGPDGRNATLNVVQAVGSGH